MSVGKTGGFGGDDKIARQRQFKRAGVTDAMHRANHGLGQERHHLDRLRLEVGLRLRYVPAHLLDIVAGGKAFAGAANDHQPNPIGLPLEVFEMGSQFHKQRLAQ